MFLRKHLIFLVITASISLFLVNQNMAIEARATQHSLNQPPAILLFIGDGMGEAHRTAGRWFSVGADGQLTMDTLSISGWSMTNNAVGATTDSAAAATAMATGEKTLNGQISLAPDLRTLPTILEYARVQGWSVGLVTTVQLAHATPAAFAAHEVSRANYTSIAVQMLEHKVNVLLAGGEDDFLPVSETGCYPEPGERTDGRNLITEAVADGYIYVCDAAGLAAVDLSDTSHLIGLFADEGMSRPYIPSLEQMTAAAIQILSRDPDGFFLMVEGGQIDWAAHENEAENVIADVLGFDAAVALGLEYAQSNGNSLLIVTADHETGGMSVDLESSGNPDEDGPFSMPDGTPFYVNWTTTGHTAVDVPTSALGEMAGGLAGTYENTHIYDIMRSIMGWQILLPAVQK